MTNNNLLFPRAKIEERLRSWWKRKTESPLFRKKADPRKIGGTVFDIQPEVSSIETVQVFLEVEPLLGFEIKGSGVVKRGGYQSCDEFVQHLLPCFEKKFNENHQVLTKPQEGMRVHVT